MNIQEIFSFIKTKKLVVISTCGKHHHPKEAVIEFGSGTSMCPVDKEHKRLPWHNWTYFISRKIT